MRRLLLIAALWALPAAPALADIAAVWSIEGKGDLRLFLRDADTFLADPEGPGALLMRDGRLWVLTADDGLQASRTWAEIERPEAAVAGLSDRRDTLRLVSLTETAARAEEAGLNGTVWQAREGGDGRSELTRDIVLADDDRLARATAALARLGEAIAPYGLVGGAPLADVAARAAKDGHGLLRYGDILRLTRLETATFSEHAYDTEPQSAQRPYDTYDFQGDPTALPEGDGLPPVN